MSTTRFKVGQTYATEQLNVRITYINGIDFYGVATDQYGNGHFHPGTITDSGTDRETIKLCPYNCREQYQYTEEKVKSIVDGWAVDRINKARVESERVTREKEASKALADIHSKYTEAQRMRLEAFQELNGIVCNAKDFKAVWNNKDAKRLVEVIEFIDTYTAQQFSNNFTNNLIF